MRIRLILAAVAAIATIIPRSGSAQTPPGATWTREVSAGLGWGHLFRYEDQTFGDRPSVTTGLAILHRTGFGLEFEINRTFGLSPAPAPCGILIDGVPATCVGNAHDGVRSAMLAAVNGQYRFGVGRFRPYVTAGIGALRSRSVWSTAFVRGDQVVLEEHELSDTGFGPDLGAGLRIELTPKASISPEVRWLDASLRSRLNLAATRVSVRAAYAW